MLHTVRCHLSSDVQISYSLYLFWQSCWSPCHQIFQFPATLFCNILIVYLGQFIYFINQGYGWRWLSSGF
jgi:hypothetical protein